ncbi:amphi-Trp domain-containing protein [Solidesulfovibrio sp.]|uniref:amphi-Trp domain-containing protein n=1 Tax=Solidesulfovibrio sp. TaxID=2910990 RepID=UPI0026308728|nr:amphi-Trp domain-containing protein [Solidesulfovibrio sp.]
MSTKTARLGGVMGVWEAADRLERLARELRAGSLGVTAGRMSMNLSPAVMLDVEIRASQGGDREGLDVRLSWRPHRPEAASLRGEF